MSLISHARKEMEMVMASCEPDGRNMQQEMNDQVMELVKLFASHCHSGATAPYALHMFLRLASFKPLIPLTGEDDEWIDVMCYEGTVWMQQNIRCTSVFREKDNNNMAYDNNAKIFTNDGGETWYSCSSSSEMGRSYITFPYSVSLEPERVYLQPEDIKPCC